MSLLTFTAKGLHCAAGDFYIDPWKPVQRAIITHGHNDHARWGSRFYLCHPLTQAILQYRLGPGTYQAVGWHQPVYINGVRITLFPAGHIIGSSQVRLEMGGETWVVSGDYKTENDGLSGQVEPVKCHTFVTESTFGLPIYRWKPQEEVYSQIQSWIAENQAQGLTSVLIVYSLGKAQRLLPVVATVSNNIFVHGAVLRV